jgi:SAM-dependent methyltransferase
VPGPERYTHGHHDSVLRSHRWRTAENSAAYLLGVLRPGMSLLDVGCGPGTITVDLARRVSPGRVVGLDASPGVLDEARNRTGDGEAPVEWEAGDVYALPFAQGTFDVVHAHQVLQHLADPVAAMVEMGRVCASGGVIAARDGDYGAMAWFPKDPALERWRELYIEVARANGGEPEAGRRLLSWARRAEFAAVKATGSLWCYATQEERSWWGGLWAERVVDSPLAEHALELGMATPAELTELADAWLRWSEDPDGWFVAPHGEVLCAVTR